MWHNRLAAVALLGVALSFSAARACNTPVYRYAMYNWAPAPYRVFYLYRGQPAEEDQQVNQTLTELPQGQRASANVIFQQVDVSQKAQLEQLPEPVKEAWQSHKEDATPIHLTFTPRAANVSAARLDSAAVKEMVDSPARARLGELLADGNAAVLLLLAGTNAAENKQAEEVARDLIAQAAAGKLPVDLSLAVPGDSGGASPEQPAGEDADRPSGGLKLAFLKLSRGDPAEKFLVRCLMAVEPDLQGYAEKPMIFAVYGRGRVLEPYIGKGITVDNLTECAAFLVGACSCMIKEQNPGVELLMRWDWESTAEAMASDDPGAAAGQLAYQEFAPDEMGKYIPSTAEERPSDSPPASSDGASVGTGSENEIASQNGSHGTQPVGLDKEAPAAESAAEPASQRQAPDGAKDRSQSPQQPQAASFAARQMWTFAAGLAVVALIVLAAGVVLMRRYSSLP